TTTRHGIRRVKVRAAINADTESIDELAAEPSANGSDDKRHDFYREQAGGRGELAAAGPHPEHEGKAKNRQDVAQGMPDTDPFGTSSGGNREPIDQAEHCGEQSTDDPSCDVPVTHRRHGRGPAPQIDSVEHNGTDKQAQRQHNEHRMNRVPEDLCTTLHRFLHQSDLRYSIRSRRSCSVNVNLNTPL